MRFVSSVSVPSGFHFRFPGICEGGGGGGGGGAGAGRCSVNY